MTASDSKTAEFARLFDLFERLAARKSRTGNGETRPTTLDDSSLPLPPDLAPVVNSLASLVRIRKPQGDKKSRGRGRRNTMASMGEAEDEDDSDESDETSLAKFPLGKRYPFTFKMMLYKLYQLDDWAEKVKQVLEKSQIEYKPLAESSSNVTEGQGEMEVEERQGGRVHFKAGVASGGPRRPYVRPRSYSVLVVGKGRDNGGAPLSPGRTPKQAILDETRAVKKRCVGRRKSMSGPLPVEAGVAKIGEGWIYDAAVSSFESTVRHEMGAFGVPVPQARSRYQSFGGIRKVGATKEGGRIMARRRALSVMEHLKLDEVKQRLVKRPLEV